MLKFNKVEKGFVVKINTRGCDLTNLPLIEIIESSMKTGHCLLQLKNGTGVFVKQTKKGFIIDLGKEDEI